MRSRIFIFALWMTCMSGAAMADEVYLDVGISQVTCKVTLGKEDRFDVAGTIEGRSDGGRRIWWSIRYSDRDSNYNYRIGPNKEGSHAIHFCDLLNAKAESRKRIHLVARACGYNCNEVRAVADTIADPQYGTGGATILK